MRLESIVEDEGGRAGFSRAHAGRQIERLQAGEIDKLARDLRVRVVVEKRRKIEVALAPDEDRPAILRFEMHLGARLDLVAPLEHLATAFDRNRRVVRQAVDAHDLDVEKLRREVRGKLRRDMEVLGLGPGTRADHDKPVGARQGLGQRIRPGEERRHEDELVASEIGGLRRDDVDVEPKLAQLPILHRRRLEMAEALGLRLDLPGPGAFVVVDDRAVGLARSLKVERGKLARHLPGLGKTGRRLVIGADQARMHLLLRERRLPPAEIADGLGAMRKCLPGPQPDHAGEGIGIGYSPVHRAGLLLHHPEAALADRAVEIVVEGLEIGIALPRVAGLALGRAAAT